MFNFCKIRGVVARYGNKKRRFAMLLCFGGTVLVLLFYVRGSKVWHAQSQNPLEMLVGTSSAHFPYLRNKGGSQWRQLRPEWKPQHRSGKISQGGRNPNLLRSMRALRSAMETNLKGWIVRQIFEFTRLFRKLSFCLSLCSLLIAKQLLLLRKQASSMFTT